MTDPSPKTARIVWVKAGGSCSICRERLLEPYASSTNTHSLGQVAHIVSRRPNGPRGNSLLTLEQCNQEPNLILLCQPHHTKVDDDVDTYTVESLHVLKRAHEQWVDSRMALETSWQTKLHNIYYINVPRLNLLASSAGMHVDVSAYGNAVALHELGWNLNGLLLSFDKLLSRVELKAVELDDAIGKGDDARGLIISFDRDFRTKNILKPESPEGYASCITGDLARDPHMYAKVQGYKVTVKIDPRWITTSTAFCEFRPSGGKGKFAGLGMITAIDVDAKTLSVTPYLLGLPTNPFIEMFS
jgi:hypothetical protein